MKDRLSSNKDIERQADETRDYVEKITNFENEFRKKSEANPKVKFKNSKNNNTGGVPQLQPAELGPKDFGKL